MNSVFIYTFKNQHYILDDVVNEVVNVDVVVGAVVVVDCVDGVEPEIIYCFKLYYFYNFKLS